MVAVVDKRYHDNNIQWTRDIWFIVYARVCISAGGYFWQRAGDVKSIYASVEPSSGNQVIRSPSAME